MIKIVNRFGILHDYYIRILNGESTISFNRITKKSTKNVKVIYLYIVYYCHIICIVHTLY